MHIKRRAQVRAIAILAAGVAAASSPAAAQTTGTTPPQTIPGLEGFSLPSSRPTPTPTPAPAATPTPGPTVTPDLAPTPVPTRTPAPRPTATATPRAIAPAPAATPTAQAEAPAPRPTIVAAPPTPVPVPTAASAPAAVVPTAATAPSPASVDAAGSGGGLGWWAGGAALVAAAVALTVWLRRRRADPEDVGGARIEDAPATAPMPVIPDAPAIQTAGVQPAAPTDRAWLTLDVLPRRAGLNLLSATVEAELVVRNTGPAAAGGIRVGCALIGATAGQETETAAAFAGPVVRPAAAPFALASGEERRLRIVVALPRGDIRPLAVAGRAMFVPVVTVNALYDAVGVAGQVARAFAVGVERVDSAKLAPFWLDQPPRMSEGLGARPYGTAIDR